MRKHIDKIFVDHALLVRLAVVDFDKHVLHNARRGSQSIDLSAWLSWYKEWMRHARPTTLSSWRDWILPIKCQFSLGNASWLANELIGAVSPKS